MAAKKHDEQPLKETEVDEFVDSNEGQETEGQAAAPTEKPAAGGNKFKRFWGWAKTHEKVSIPIAAVVLLVVLLAVPWTRYGLVGTVWRQDFTVRVLDKDNKTPVSSATVTLGDKKVLTDNRGKATIKMNSGYASLSVEKKYYKDEKREVVVPILKQKDEQVVRIEATGRQVPVLVVNKISKKPVANVKISAEGTEAKTDKDGKATLVLPADKRTVEATFTASGFNGFKQSLKVAEGETATAELVPAGRVFFLSNASGKIDVVSTNLDGSDRKVVLEGTGKEDRYNTYLLASRDWKYLALHAKRDSEKAKLYLIETESGRITVMDEGDADFSSIGWSGHRFVYSVLRSKVNYWENNKQALKSYDAEAKKITTLDETKGQGTPSSYAYEYLGGAYILENEIVYVKRWNAANNYWFAPVSMDGKQHTLNSVKPDSKSKKVVKGYPVSTSEYNSLDIRAYGPQELYIMFSVGNTRSVEKYEAGSVKPAADVTQDEFYEAYETYLVSPSGEKTFWTDLRDGSSVFFLGDKRGQGEKQIGSLKDYSAYGWFTDDYLLVSKKASELYILPAGEGVSEQSTIKITDYYRAGYDFRGYGYGYGGL